MFQTLSLHNLYSILSCRISIQTYLRISKSLVYRRYLLNPFKKSCSFEQLILAPFHCCVLPSCFYTFILCFHCLHTVAPVLQFHEKFNFELPTTCCFWQCCTTSALSKLTIWPLLLNMQQCKYYFKFLMKNLELITT